MFMGTVSRALNWALECDLGPPKLEGKEMILYGENRAVSICPKSQGLSSSLTPPDNLAWRLSKRLLIHPHNQFYIDEHTLPHNFLASGLAAGKQGHLH